jgi:hypothetical protein
MDTKRAGLFSEQCFFRALRNAGYRIDPEVLILGEKISLAIRGAFALQVAFTHML